MPVLTRSAFRELLKIEKLNDFPLLSEDKQHKEVLPREETTESHVYFDKKFGYHKQGQIYFDKVTTYVPKYTHFVQEEEPPSILRFRVNNRRNRQNIPFWFLPQAKYRERLRIKSRSKPRRPGSILKLPIRDRVTQPITLGLTEQDRIFKDLKNYQNWSIFDNRYFY